MKNLFLGVFFAFGMVDSIREFGKPRANPYASNSNNLKLSDTCTCTPSEAACQDTIKAEVEEGNVDSVMFAGVEFSTAKPIMDCDGNTVKSAPGPIAVTDTKALEAWLCDVVETHEIDISLNVTYEDGILCITHIGSFPLTGLVIDGAEAIEAERCCDLEMVIKWVGQGLDEIPDLSWGGNAETLANGPYAYSGNPVTDAATALTLEANINAALTALGITLTEPATVTVNDVSGAYDITYYSSSDEAVLIGTNPFQNCGSEEMFVCNDVEEDEDGGVEEDEDGAQGQLASSESTKVDNILVNSPFEKGESFNLDIIDINGDLTKTVTNVGPSTGIKTDILEDGTVEFELVDAKKAEALKVKVNSDSGKQIDAYAVPYELTGEDSKKSKLELYIPCS